MPSITVTPDAVTVRLSMVEKVGALHSDLSIPRANTPSHGWATGSTRPCNLPRRLLIRIAVVF
jgi:hypothetical protein